MDKKIILMAALMAGSFTGAYAQNEILDAAAAAAAAVNEAEKTEAPAPKPNYWTNSIGLAIGFTTTSLHSWAAGGYDTATLNSSFDGKANYKKDLMAWNNRLRLEYGFLYSEDKEGLIQKTNDRVYLESTWSYQTAKDSKLSYSAAFNFRSQFSNGYTYKTPGEGQKWKDAAVLKSSLLSPAYTNIALGINWVPNKWFTLNVAPLTGGFTIVRNEPLRLIYGMDPRSGHEASEALKDAKGLLTNGDIFKAARFEFGAQIKADFKMVINDVFKYETQLVLFSDYLHEPKNLRVNWDNQISWQLSKYFALGLKTWLIYDPNVLIVDDDHPNGIKLVQFKDFVSFNFTYTFDFKKK